MHIVLTTIIILVASVILASAVVLYGTSLFQSATQQEYFTVFSTKLWVHSSDDNGLAWGAFSARNGGDKIVSLNKISIRGQDVPFSQWYPDTSVTSSLIQQPMNFTGWSGTGGQLTKFDPNDYCGAATFTVEAQLIDQTDGSVCANAASGPVSLEPGNGVIIYYKLINGTLQTIDSGYATSVGIYSERSVTAIRVTILGI